MLPTSIALLRTGINHNKNWWFIITESESNPSPSQTRLRVDSNPSVNYGKSRVSKTAMNKGETGNRGNGDALRLKKKLFNFLVPIGNRSVVSKNFKLKCFKLNMLLWRAEPVKILNFQKFGLYSQISFLNCINWFQTPFIFAKRRIFVLNY